MFIVCQEKLKLHVIPKFSFEFTINKLKKKTK